MGVDPSVEYGVTPQDLQGKGTFFTNRGIMIYLYSTSRSMKAPNVNKVG